jgi:hypothetical protein
MTVAVAARTIHACLPKGHDLFIRQQAHQHELRVLSGE